MATLYSFDTSSLLNGRRDLLPPEVFPTLWRSIEAMIDEGAIMAVDEVRNELSRRDDEVCTWAKSQRNLFVPLDEDVQSATRIVLAKHEKLMGVGGGRNAADPFVIGLATARDAAVVTEESRSGSLNKPRIPDVCDDLGVGCINLIGFVLEQGWSY